MTAYIEHGEKNLTRYLKDISTLSLIQPQEEVLLAKRIKNNDREALTKLVTANLRFVISIAKNYKNQGLPLNDLVNEGNLGLIQAALRFDETRGYKFISYAVWWIRQHIIQAIQENSRVIRLPQNKIKDISNLNLSKIKDYKEIIFSLYNYLLSLKKAKSRLRFVELYGVFLSKLLLF